MFDDYMKNKVKMYVEDFPLIREVLVSEEKHIVCVHVSFSTKLLFDSEDWCTVHDDFVSGDMFGTSEMWKVVYLDDVHVFGSTKGYQQLYKREYFKYEEYLTFIDNNLYEYYSHSSNSFNSSIITLCKCLEGICKFTLLSFKDGSNVDDLCLCELIDACGVIVPKVIRKNLLFLSNVYTACSEENFCYRDSYTELSKSKVNKLFKGLVEYCYNCIYFVYIRGVIENEC